MAASERKNPDKKRRAAKPLARKDNSAKTSHLAKIGAAKQSLPYILYLSSRLMTVHHQKNVRSFGVHAAESFVLLELWQDAELSQGELAKRLRVNHASIGQAVRRLELGGFVTRWKQPEDRRIVMTGLTAKGANLRDSILGAALELNEELESVLGRDKARAAAQILGELVAYYDDILNAGELEADD